MAWLMPWKSVSLQGTGADFQPVLQYPIGCQGCALGYNTLQQGPTVWAHLSEGWRPSPTPAGSLVIVTGNQIKIP